jgi:hypothetical protein
LPVGSDAGLLGASSCGSDGETAGDALAVAATRAGALPAAAVVPQPASPVSTRPSRNTFGVRIQ